MANLVNDDVPIRKYDDVPKVNMGDNAVDGDSQKTANVDSSVIQQRPSQSEDKRKDTRKRPNSEVATTSEASGKKLKFSPMGGPLLEKDIPEDSGLKAYHQFSADQIILSAVDMLRYAAGKVPTNVDQLRKDKEKAVKAAKVANRRADMLEAQLKKEPEAKKNLLKFGPLPPAYPSVVVQRFVKTQDFENLFKMLVRKARSLGASEGLRARVKENPDLVNHGLPSLDVLDKYIDGDKADLKQSFEDAISDKNCNFAFTEYLKMRKILPSLERLQAVTVDYNETLPEEMRPLVFSDGEDGEEDEVDADADQERRTKQKHDDKDANVR